MSGRRDVLGFASFLRVRRVVRLSRFGRHFVRIREIKAFERRLIALIVERPGALNDRHQALFRYATALAQAHLFRTPEGRDVSVSEEVDPLRKWFLESIVPLLPEGGEPNVDVLRDIAPVLALRLDHARTKVLENHHADFAAEHLDDEMRHKAIALVLGGGSSRIG